MSNHKTWIRRLQFFLGISLLWLIAMILLLISSLDIGKIHNLCKNSFFVVTRFGGELIVISYFIIALIVTRSVDKIKHSTAYELLLKRKQEMALKKMWFTIIFFVLINLYLFVYDILLYVVKPTNCDEISDNLTIDTIIWGVSRFIADIIWVFPVIYVFWEKPIGLHKVTWFNYIFCCLCCRNKNKTQGDV